MRLGVWLVLGMFLVAATPAASATIGLKSLTPWMEAPAEEEVVIQLNLTGVATQTNGGPNSGFTAYLNASGDGTRKTSNGQGIQIKAKDLVFELTIVRADGVQVEKFNGTVNFHAQQASVSPPGFKFNLELTGKRSRAIVGNDNPAERVLAMNANGKTTGAAENGDGLQEVDGKGQVTTKPDGTGPARHFNIDYAGTGFIMKKAAPLMTL